jgi:hypothetical protein
MSDFAGTFGDVRRDALRDRDELIPCRWQAKSERLRAANVCRPDCKEAIHVSIYCVLVDRLENVADLLTDERFDELRFGELHHRDSDAASLWRAYCRVIAAVDVALDTLEAIVHTIDPMLVSDKRRAALSRARSPRAVDDLRAFASTGVVKHGFRKGERFESNHHADIVFADGGATETMFTNCRSLARRGLPFDTILMPRLRREVTGVAMTAARRVDAMLKRDKLQLVATRFGACETNAGFNTFAN